MNLLLVAPIVLPMTAAVIGILLRGSPAWQRFLSLLGPLAIFGSGFALTLIVERDGIQATSLGAWPAPFGIVLVADQFSAFMLTVPGLVSLATIVFSFATVHDRNLRFGHYSVVNLMLVGVAGAFLTGDIFNLFVWFELMLISSFVLIALGGGRRRIEGSVKYVAINLVSSAFFLAGTGLLYAITGTLNMADLATRIADQGDSRTVLAAFTFIGSGCGTDVAVIIRLGDLTFTPELNLYVYDDSRLPGSARYHRLSLGLAYAWAGKHQRR